MGSVSILMEDPEEKLDEEILNGVALRPRVNSARCPRALVVMRGAMLVMGTMLPRVEDVEEVVVRSS